MYVYKITNQVNGKIYVGKYQGHNLRSYLNTKIHRAEKGLRDCVYLARAIRKYGRDAFVIEPIVDLPDDTDPKVLGDLERFYIKELRSQDPVIGYNISSGGEGGSGPVSDAHKKRLSHVHRGKVLSAETRAKLAAVRTGKRHSSDTRRRMSIAAKGRVTSKETRTRLSSAHSERWSDPEFKRIHADILQRSTTTPEALEQRSQVSKKLAARYTPEYRAWAARKAASVRWNRPFDEPRPSMYV